LEQLQGSLDAGEAQLVVLEGQIDQAKAALATQQAELKTEFTQVQGERAQLASAIPEDLMALYERIREHKGGVAAAALRRKECLGCGLVLNTAELAMVASAPADDVLRCEECSRILVRTSESGL
ncbi:MAG: C4-type zinc ribbon domain-containing protein, partial [Marmoricola sp.]